MKLIIPIAGQSKRFNSTRPKWMLTHPSGRFMVVESILGLNLNDFEVIYFVGLKEHEEKFHYLKGLKEELDIIGILSKCKFILLDAPTQGQAETVTLFLEQNNIEGFIFIKDSDNFFKTNINVNNQICYFTLNESSLINPKNKSYLRLDSNGTVISIIEKNVIGPNFSVGGYGFKCAKEFIKTFKQVSSIVTNRELYISDIIFQMLLDGALFGSNKVEKYLDWGTSEDWERYKKAFMTLFIDLDGTLVENSSYHLPPYTGEGTPLKKNIDYVNFLYNSGQVQVILTTSRPERYRGITEKELDKIGLCWDHLLMELYHSKRVIVNDFSDSNKFPSCLSINLNRNSDNLKDLMRNILE